MKVSIITSCFNREKTIRSAIESVQAQDYPDIEHIVVDGASTDNTLNIVKEYSANIAKIISEPDTGMYEGLNKGLRLATGDVIGLLHSDDVFFATDTISKIVRQFEQTNADFLYGNGVIVNGEDHNHIIRDWVSGPYRRSRIEAGWLPLHTTVFIRRTALIQCGFYNENYRISADSDWLVRCLYEQPLKVTYLNNYIVQMRTGGLSTNPHNVIDKWKEDVHMYRSHGLSGFTLFGKVLSKIPQFFRPSRDRLLGRNK